MFTDTHCHIFNEYYDNIHKVINESELLEVNRFFNNATDINSIKEVLKLIKLFPNMYGAIGIHPEVVDTYSSDDVVFLEKHLKDDKIIAIGEIGLDYYYSKDNRDKQIDLFSKQLQLAEKYDLPVIVHSRDATQDTIDILRKYKVKGVIHSFSGSFETANIYIKMGFLLGINGVITFKNSKLSQVIKRINPDNIVFETDSPYLTPVPFRGTQNIPGRILDIVSFVSEFYGLSKSELAEVTNKNIKRIFDI